MFNFFGSDRSVIQSEHVCKCKHLDDGSKSYNKKVFQLFDGAFSTRIHNALRVLPSPFKVNGDQSTDGASGHEAFRAFILSLHGAGL